MRYIKAEMGLNASKRLSPGGWRGSKFRSETTSVKPGKSRLRAPVHERPLRSGLKFCDVRGVERTVQALLRVPRLATGPLERKPA